MEGCEHLMEHLKAILEAMIFSAPHPVSLDKIQDAMPEVPSTEVEAALEALMNDYRQPSRGISLIPVGGGYQLRTRHDLSDWVRRVNITRPATLSPAALETLAIIAYRQPIVKAEIDRLRGVDVAGPLKGLLEKKLVRILGRQDIPGKPIIYGTTKRFLEVFGLDDLSELPTLRELREVGE